MAANFDDILNEREALLRQRADIDRRLRLIEDFIKLSQKLRVSPEVTQDLFSPTEPARGSARERNVLSPATITGYVRQVLIEAGRPLKRGAILRELDLRDVPIVGGDRAKVLGTMIWRARRDDGEPAFENTPKGYWPSDLPMPE
ncbi:hypothetical protein [Aquamicrobium defluvii]|uniref:hypothetical protein n=1 Tax=Aquamicrobium defluvii TaxID=69279 RepID=UPI001AACBDEA|nr:hypothetical protein [Aquamicrobium defluvii]